MPDNSAEGIISIPGRQGVDATVAKLQEMLDLQGVKIFAIVDHSGEAAQAGIAMRNTKLVIFGNPRTGTPLMLAAPSAALDLPLKILVWEDAAGNTWLTYNSVDCIARRHHLPPDLAAKIAVIDKLAL